MSQILLVRPGQTDFDVQHRIQGGLDLPLNEDGHKEVEELVQALANQSIDLILTGPNDPSSGTAEILAEKLDIPLKTCDGLRNLNQGLWEGLEFEEVKRKFPSVYKHWEEAPAEVSIPNAESAQQAALRVEKALKKYARKVPCVLIVATEPLATLVACLVEGRKLCLQQISKPKKRCLVQELKPQI